MTETARAEQPAVAAEFGILSILHTLGMRGGYTVFPGVSAYPGTFLEMWSMFVDRDVDGAPEGLKNAQCIRIDFARNKAALSVVK